MGRVGRQVEENQELPLCAGFSSPPGIRLLRLLLLLLLLLPLLLRLLLLLRVTMVVVVMVTANAAVTICRPS